MFLAPGVGAAAPFGFEPALVSAPQYSPANNTVAVDGSWRSDEEESNDATPATAPGAVLTYCML